MEFEKICEIIADKQDVDVSVIAMETTLESLGIDSLTMVEIVMDIEEAFDITFKNDELKTVGQVVEYVQSLLNA